MLAYQYPHTLWVWVKGNSTLDENGVWSVTLPVLTYYGVCGERGNIREEKIRGIDGDLYQYTSKVSMPTTVNDIPVGTMIQIKQGDTVRATGEVKSFYRGQLICRLWL